MTWTYVYAALLFIITYIKVLAATLMYFKVAAHLKRYKSGPPQ